MERGSFIYNTDASILSLILFVLMLLCIYLGRLTGLRKSSLRNESETSTTGTIVSAMLGLMAFLLAFTFGMSGSRFDARRVIVVDEANAIGTSILRADLYPADQRTAFRNDFKQYLEARITFFEAGKHFDKINKSQLTADDVAKRIWDRAAQLSRNPDHYVASLQMIPALNAMFDIRTSRFIGELARVPDSIVLMLFIMLLSTGFYLGYSSASKGKLDWFVAVGFCLLTSTVIYITLDLDRPRRGLINLSTSQTAMVELRKLF